MNEKIRRPNRVFTPEQKFEILKDIEQCRTIREGLQKHQIATSVYHRWKRQLTHLPQFATIFHKIRHYFPRKLKDIKPWFLETGCSAEKPLATVL